MECNKEEALRAKDIAERKMQDKDFVGARKFASKAQQLYPNIDNISQMICVCDVHCSAENVISGIPDWYGVLQVGETSDDALIKKQYRKLALTLHPDKNKFSGAESAFKLIGEAQRVLLDKEKRSYCDLRRRAAFKPVVPNQASKQTSTSFNPAPPRSRVRKNTMSKCSTNAKGGSSSAPFRNPKKPAQARAQARSGTVNARETFWTACPFCSVRYQYRKDVANRCVRCQTCQKDFCAQPGSDATRPVFPGQDASNSVSDKGSDNLQRKQELGSKPPRKAKGASGRKRSAESSESFESDSSLGSDSSEMQSDTRRYDNVGDHHSRRSARNKQRVSYNENGSDDDENMNLPKREKGDENSEQPSSFFRPEAERVFVGDSSAEMVPGPTFHEYPDPEFCDFDKDREEHCFKVGQVWAAYDTVDAMPRFYAVIKKVYTPKFRVQITWLEPDPDDEDGVKWVGSELPFSCGKFKLGGSEYSEDRLMFSHLVSFWDYMGSVGGGCMFKIYPRKGETWALFKSWDPKWFQISENERKYEYEFVEVLSGYDESVGVRVARMAKLKGFSSLFCRIDDHEMQIPPSEVLRFSHKVPSYRMTGDERKDVPRGSFELDPASISMKPEETSLPNKVRGPTYHVNKVEHLHNQNVDVNRPEFFSFKVEVEHVHNLNVDVHSQELPDPEFFNFDGLKSPDKFKVNQVWALYSDTDDLPRYYGVVKKVEPYPNFKVHIAWLHACYLASDVVLWTDKLMPISCGKFKIKGSTKVQHYTTTSSFSHQLRADETARKNVFAIYPREGEVWAVYKDWHADMRSSGLRKFEYEIVEVLGKEVQNENEGGPSDNVRVLFLERVEGFHSVFRARKNGDSFVKSEELLRFSHQVPGFRLTEERGGSLRGCWELDPAALPAHSLYKFK